MGVEVVRRVQHQASGRDLGGGAPVNGGVMQIELLHPDPPQDPHGRDAAQPHRCVRVSHGGEQVMAILADGLSQGGALGLGARQALGTERAVLVAHNPAWFGVDLEPVRRGSGQSFQGKAHRFRDAGQAVETAYGSEHVRGVGALPASRPHEVARARQVQNGVKQEPLDPAGDEPRGELAQHAAVKPRIAQR